MQKKISFLGALFIFALFFSFSFQDQKPTQKLSDLPDNNSGIPIVTQQDRTFISTLSTDDIEALTFQDFEGTTFPPTGWTITFTGTNYWTRFLVSAYGVGVASAKFDFFAASAGTTQSLVTPVLPVSVAGDSLKFDHAYATYTTENDVLVVETSTDGGTTFTTLQTLNGGVSGPLVTAPPTTAVFVPTAGQWATKKYGLPLGTNKVSFKCISAFGNNLYLDNIAIGTPVAEDVGMLSINLPPNLPPNPTIPQATVKNYGSATQTFPVTMTISPGGYTSTQTVTALAPGATQNVNFSSWTPSNGNSSVTCYTQLSTDLNRTNDTLRTNVSVTASYWVNRTAMPLGRDLGTGVGYSRNDTGWVFILGGELATNSVYRFNLRTNTWATMANLPLGKDRQGSAALKDSIYSIGGSTVDPSYTTDFYKYDIKANTWVSKAPLPGPLGWCKGLGYQDSLIYVAGGYTGSATVAQVLLYNSNTNSWRTATSMPGIRFGGGFAVKGDTLVYVSGVDGAAIVTTVYKGVISQTDRSVITWTTGAALPAPLSTGQFRFDAHTWGNKGIIITGGSTLIPFTSVSNACMSYSPGANVWSTLPNKITAWTAGQSGVAFSNGALKLVCAGGYSGTATVTNTEMYTDSSALVGISNQSVSSIVPSDYALLQNYPNPFNPTTTISFSIPKSGLVTLKIYNVLGKELATLVNEVKSAGSYNLNFNATELSSGVYFYKIESGNFSDIKRMMLIK